MTTSHTPPNRHDCSAAHAHFWTRRLTRWESIRLRCTWPYIRQTRLLNPLTEWWLNRG